MQPTKGSLSAAANEYASHVDKHVRARPRRDIAAHGDAPGSSQGSRGEMPFHSLAAALFQMLAVCLLNGVYFASGVFTHTYTLDKTLANVCV